MPIYRHRFTGLCAAGDEWSYQWYVTSVRDIDTAHGAAIVWNAAVWNGASAGNGYKDHCAVNVFTSAVITAEINVPDGRQLNRRETGQVIAGTALTNSMPADVSLVVSLRTALPQASGRGRFYLPQPAAGNLTVDGRVTADLTNDLNASLLAAWGAYNTGVDYPVLYSPTFRTTRKIISYNIGDLFDTQRRRENKVKEVRTGNNMP